HLSSLVQDSGSPVLRWGSARPRAVVRVSHAQMPIHDPYFSELPIQTVGRPRVVRTSTHMYNVGVHRSSGARCLFSHVTRRRTCPKRPDRIGCPRAPGAPNSGPEATGAGR